MNVPSHDEIVAAWERTLVLRSIIDLFAGPGGWDVACAWLGFDPHGVEWDAAACDTRRAAGLRTDECDVAALDPKEVMARLGIVTLYLLIASPPCQTFSAAGTGEGRAFLSELAAIALSLLGFPSDEALQARALLEEADPRSLLVLEPARWIAECKPRNVALEQVPAVLPIWEAIADGMRRLGYSVWTGVLSAEQYGVPQTRKRAILVASLDREVREPAPTHKRYVAPKKDREDMDHLFAEETPARGRITHAADHGLREWVSMADALGWGMAGRPSTTVTARERQDGRVLEGGSGAARAIAHEINGGNYVPLTSAVAVPPSWSMSVAADRSRRARSGEAHNAPRPVTEPALTIDTRGDLAQWVPEPSGTLATGQDVWVTERPSTTVACDPRISPPGHHADGTDAGPRQMDNAIRVTQQEAAVLQSFPATYPWQGTKSKQFQQIGNAVPPLLAAAVLRTTLGIAIQPLEATR